MLRFARLLALGGMVIATAATMTMATPIDYGDFPGASAGDVDFLSVTEDSATDDTPLYDAPVHVGNKLIFNPLTFASASANGSGDATNGVLTMGIRADQGQFLSYILVREIGDYTISGVGTSATFANIFGSVSALDVTPGTHGTANDSLAFSPSPVYALPAASFDEFSGIAVIDLTGLAISEVFLTLDNSLVTGSEAGTTSFIQKKVITIEHSQVPEPATLGLLAIGMVAWIRRRRA